MTTVTNQQLREFILASFNENELYTFCFDYFEGVEHNFSDSMPMLKKVIELISYCNRYKIKENLLVALEQERPQTYRAAFGIQQLEHSARPRVYVPQPRNPNQVFISHASEDAELAHRIATDLARNGYDIFITPDSIQPGEKWVPAINRGLEESGIFIVLLTPDAVQSGWVQDETNTAIALANAGQMRLFMLYVQPCQPPLLWQQRQFIPFRGDDYKRNLANLQQALAGKTIQPSPQIEVTPSAPKNPYQSQNQKQIPFVHKKTGLEFVRIPAGEFIYRHKSVEIAGWFKFVVKPVYEEGKIYLPEYWISKTPITQALYQRFITANPKQNVPFVNEDWAKPYNWDGKKRIFPADKAEHPIVLISFYDAVAYCKWAGLQLPTEEQWEKAARGTDGRTYPWGNNEPTDKLCNFRGNVRSTTPVGYYSPQGDSPYGCVDMSGNVWEWCLNKYKTPKITMIDESNHWRVMRGGSWDRDQYYVSTAVRYGSYLLPDSRFSDFGFRVVIDRPLSQ